MVGFLCATPYHIIAAITMAHGTFASQETTLVLLDHFEVNDELIARICSTGAFTRVIICHSNKKTVFNNFKRLYHAFVPSVQMRTLGKERQFDHFICFALDFIDMTYLMCCWKKRGVRCTFAYGDDGIGSYINNSLYKPKKVSRILLHIIGRWGLWAAVQEIYLYKPDFRIANMNLCAYTIVQNDQTMAAVQNAVTQIWPQSSALTTDNTVLYLEQPLAFATLADVEMEQHLLQRLEKQLHMQVLVKLHPRTSHASMWKNFSILKTAIPHEALLLQSNGGFPLTVSSSSTALFSSFLLDACKTSRHDGLLLFHLLPRQQSKQSHTDADRFDRLISKIRLSIPDAHLFLPKTQLEFETLIETLNYNTSNTSN